jgi:hypothetical protein
MNLKSYFNVISNETLLYLRFLKQRFLKHFFIDFIHPIYYQNCFTETASLFFQTLDYDDANAKNICYFHGNYSSNFTIKQHYRNHV